MRITFTWCSRVRVLGEALDGDDAEHAILRDERHVDDRLRPLRQGAVLERTPLLLERADVLLDLRVDVVDQHGLAVLDAPHRELVAIRGVSRVRRVPLALLDRQSVLDLVPVGVVQADAEHFRVGELVHVLVEPVEDGVDVERRRDLAPNLAEQLDVLLALAFGSRQRLGRLGPQPRLGEPRPFAFPVDHAPPQYAGEAEEHQPGCQEVAGVGPPCPVPRRQDDEGVRRLVARPGQGRSAHASGTCSLQIPGWCNPAAPHAPRPTTRGRGRPASTGTRWSSRRGSPARRTRTEGRWMTVRDAAPRWPHPSAEEDARLVDADAAHQGGEAVNRHRGSRRVVADEAQVGELQPGDAVALREDEPRRLRGAEPAEGRPVRRPGAVAPLPQHDGLASKIEIRPPVRSADEPESAGDRIDADDIKGLVPDEPALSVVEPRDIRGVGAEREIRRPSDVHDRDTPLGEPLRGAETLHGGRRPGGIRDGAGREPHVQHALGFGAGPQRAVPFFEYRAHVLGDAFHAAFVHPAPVLVPERREAVPQPDPDARRINGRDPHAV